MTRNLQILKYLFWKTKIRKVFLNNDFQDSIFKKIKFGGIRLTRSILQIWLHNSSSSYQMHPKGPNKAGTKKISLKESHEILCLIVTTRSLLLYINTIIYKEKKEPDCTSSWSGYLTICCHGNNVTFSLGFSGDSRLRVRRVFLYLHRSTSWCEQSSTFHQHTLGCVFCTDEAARHRLSTWEMTQISYMTHFILIDKKYEYWRTSLSVFVLVCRSLSLSLY